MKMPVSLVGSQRKLTQLRLELSCFTSAIPRNIFLINDTYIHFPIFKFLINVCNM